MKKIAHMSWQYFQENMKEERLVIIPTGAVEAYGPHLPLGTDTLVAEKITEELAERMDAWIAPTISYGDSTSMKAFPGTLVMKAESFKGCFDDLIESLLGWGFKHFLMVNGHAGNTPIIGQVCYKYLSKNPDLDFVQVDWWRYVTANSQEVLDNIGYMAHGHASECATSIMLYLYPELVDHTKIGCSLPKIVNGKRYPNLIKYTNFNDFTDTGSIGDARQATREKGQKIVENCIEQIISTLESNRD